VFSESGSEGTDAGRLRRVVLTYDEDSQS
jgi:hypothetical protein